MSRTDPRSLPDSSDAPELGPTWTPPLTKLRVYEAVYTLNRTFEAAMLAVDRLERLEFFDGEDLGMLKTRLDYLRAGTNSALVEKLQEYEEDEAGRLFRITYEWDKARGDPDDVFFEARHRREEIKEQMKELQSGLARQKPPKGRKARRKKRRR